MEYKVADFTIICQKPLLQPARDLLADALAEAGFESFEETPSGLKGYVQRELLDKEKLDTAIRELPLADVKVEYTLADVPNQNWNALWEEHGFDPIRIGRRVVIVDARREQQSAGTSRLSAESAPQPPSRDGARNLRHPVPNAQPNGAEPPMRILIEPRQAFGSGTHETTRLMVSALLDMDLHGKRVLDCGCGTGILGIVASRLGASDVVAYDIDEWSVENAKHNAQLNGVDNLSIFSGDAHVLGHISGLFDVVLANINRNILLSDMPAFREVMASEARLALSGFYQQDEAMLVEKAASLNLALASRRNVDGWSCLTFVAR